MEGVERLIIFLAVLAIMMAWELIVPRRELLYSKGARWLANFSLSILSTILMRLTIASAALLTASHVTSQHLGFLNLFELPGYFKVILSLVLLDLAIYWQHRASHAWKWLWRFHKVHHSDLDFDVTTAIRFHPIEIFISMCYKVICILIIGATPLAVITFEIILSSCALFNHSNIKLPLCFDKYLRLVIVTPDMHRVHHSVIKTEMDSNFGFSISVWDRLFTSYIAQPVKGHQDMQIGLSQYQYATDVRVSKLLLMPFKQ